MNSKRKIVYIEILRIMAVFGVIYSHMMPHVISAEDAYGSSGCLYVLWNALYTISKTAVPVFFMISGCLLLEKEESISTILKKRVLRMVIVLVLFSGVFYLAMVNEDWSQFSLIGYLNLIFGRGVGTYWYLYAYIALMLQLPFLRAIALKAKQNPILFDYLILLKIGITIIVPIIELLNGESFHSSFAIVLANDPIFYMLMGYYFGKVRKVNSRDICIMGVVAIGMLVLEGGLNLLYSFKIGQFSQYFSLKGIVVVTLEIFISIQWLFEHVRISEKFEKCICWIGGVTFPLYLIENILGGKMMFINEILMGIMPIPIAFLIYLNATVLVGVMLGAIMKKLPILKKIL